jgi:death-on-curing protein
MEAVIAIQAELIAEHGGLQGPPRLNDLQAALARPQNHLAYAAQPPTISRLAAAYGFALARGHCFPDGNKRIALALVDVFLQMNGFELDAAEPETANVFLRLAAGELSEEELAGWIEGNTARLRR